MHPLSQCVFALSCVCLLVMVGCVCCQEQDNNESENYNFNQYPVPVYKFKSPVYRIYLEWILQKLQNKGTLNSHEYQFLKGAMDKRDKDSRIPALEAYFTYQINREKCINLGDEGCINGSIPGSGSDSGYLNGGNNPGK